MNFLTPFSSTHNGTTGHLFRDPMKYVTIYTSRDHFTDDTWHCIVQYGQNYGLNHKNATFFMFYIFKILPQFEKCYRVHILGPFNIYTSLNDHLYFYSAINFWHIIKNNMDFLSSKALKIGTNFKYAMTICYSLHFKGPSY